MRNRKTMKQNNVLKLIGFSNYLSFLVIISLYVFKANDESQALVEIFHLVYLIPVLIYSIGTLTLCYLIFQLLSKLINNVISFSILFIIGIPLGIIIIQNVFILLLKQIPSRLAIQSNNHSIASVLKRSSNLKMKD